MFIRDTYSAEEAEALRKWRERSLSLVGWMPDFPTVDIPYPVRFRTATKEVIEHQAFTVDFKNLLYRDESYANKTRWGGIIAPPLFCKSVASAGPFHWFQMPPSVGKLDSLQICESFEFYKSIRPGDSFRVWVTPATIEDVTDDGEQPFRKYRIREEIRYFNQNDELVVIAYRDNKECVFSQPDAEYGKVFRMGYEMVGAFGGELDLSSIKWTDEWCYSKEDIKAIDDVYAGEVRQAEKIRYWEDVEVGDELDKIVYGPITVWDCSAHLATFGAVPMPMMEIRTRTPFEVQIDPVTNIPHKSIEMHLGGRAPHIMNCYSPTIIETIIENFFARLASNWMGNDGMIRRLSWQKMANTPFGDTIFGRGRVLRKYVEDGKCLVDISSWMETNRGYISNAGPLTIELMSRQLLENGRLPETPAQDEIDQNPNAIKPGDRVRIQPRPDWELPSGYPLSGTTASVVAYHQVDGFVYCVLDEDIIGIDTRVVLGFRLDALEKI